MDFPRIPPPKGASIGLPSSFQAVFEDGAHFFRLPSSFRAIFEDGRPFFAFPSSICYVFEDGGGGQRRKKAPKAAVLEKLRRASKVGVEPATDEKPRKARRVVRPKPGVIQSRMPGYRPAVQAE